MTRSDKTDNLLTALEDAVLDALRESTGKERTDVIAAGIKLAAIKHRLRDDDGGDYFG